LRDNVQEKAHSDIGNNMDKKYTTIIICLLTILMAACSPTQQAIQTAVSNTQAASTPADTAVVTSSPTSTPTPLPPTPALTKTTYILETGMCMVLSGNVIGNPSNYFGCALSSRSWVQLGPNESVQFTYNNPGKGQQIYCSLYSLSGKYIMSNLDNTGSGMVTCNP
jgi:hypothetical protein